MCAAMSSASLVGLFVARPSDGIAVDRNGVALKAGQIVKVHQEEGTRTGIVVDTFPLNKTCTATGCWVDVNIEGRGPEGIPSYILEVIDAPATPSAAVGADEPGAGDEKEWCDGAKEFCERQVESETVPRAEYDRVVTEYSNLLQAAARAITERASSDSKPKNCHNPESEDTPPHNPVMGPVVGTATVKHQTSCPAATAPTVPPEVGKRYVCGNGEVTDAMTLDGGPAYPFMARTGHVLRSWRGDGRHDESKISEYDLIAEHHDPEPSPPAESADDWVMITDPDHIARPCDECCCNRIGYEWAPCLGLIGSRIRHFGDWKFRCRRKDLPVVSDKREKTIQVVKDIAEVGILPADKPSMRQVTLSEYLSATGKSHWTTSQPYPQTGRTAVVEVPE